MANAIRTFSVSLLHGLDYVVQKAIELGLQVIPSAYLNDLANWWAPPVNQEEMDSLAYVLNHSDLSKIPFAVVGSEATSLQHFSIPQIIQAINTARASAPAGVKFTTAELWGVYRDHPELVAAVDVIFVNIHPYWESVSIDQAVGFVVDKYNLLKSMYPGKPIVISETGWPSAGPDHGAAVASLANEQLFWEQFLVAAKQNGIDYFGFEAFDETWKASTGEGAVGAHWGLWDAGCHAKSSVTSFDPRPHNSDFDGDARSDILWQNDNGQPAIWLINGTTLLSGGALAINPGPSWHAIGAGDFNGDGKADILWQNDNGQAAIWLMDGTSLRFGTAVGANPGPSSHIKDAGDFNGDGTADILWQNDDGSARVWLMFGTNVFFATSVGGNLDPAWHAEYAKDFTSDGRADILWQNDNGQASLWQMNGINVMSSTALGDNLAPSWHIDWT